MWLLCSLLFQGAGKEKPVDKVDAGSVRELPDVKELMLRGQMMPQGTGGMMPKVDHDPVGVQLADVLSNPDDKISAQKSDDDGRDLIIPIGGHAARDIPHYHDHMDFLWKHPAGGLSAGE